MILIATLAEFGQHVKPQINYDDLAYMDQTNPYLSISQFCHFKNFV